MSISAPGSSPASSSTDVLAKLTAISDEKLLEVMKYLSTVPATAETLKLMDKLRPKLRKLRPPRPLALKRLWCRAFEDLLQSGAVEADSGRISRTVIEPCWSLLVERGGAWLPGFQAELRTLSPREPQRVLDLAERLWSRSAEAIGDALAQGAEIAHLALIRDAVAAGSAIEAFKRAAPDKPIKQFGEAELAHAELGLVELVRRGLPTYGFLMVVAARLRNPGDLLLLKNRVDAGFSPALLRQLSVLTVSSLDGQAQDFERLSADAGPNEIARKAEELMRSLAVAQGGLDEATRKYAGERSEALTTAVRNVLGERVIDPAPAQIGLALPGSETAASRDALIAAEEHARSLGRSRPVAKWAGIEKQAAETANSICRRFEEKVGELLDKVDRDGDGDVSVEKDIYRSIRIIELVDGPHRAQRLMVEARRRLKACWALQSAR